MTNLSEQEGMRCPPPERIRLRIVFVPSTGPTGNPTMADSDIAAKVKLQDAHDLAQGYNKKVRALEISPIIAFAAMMVGFVCRIAPHASENWWIVIAAILCGYLAADFMSGFVH